MTESVFKYDALKYAGLNCQTGSLRLFGNLIVEGNGTFINGISNTGNTTMNDLIVNGNAKITGQINALGNVVAPFFIGNGSQLTGVTSTLPGTANLDILNGNITGSFANVSNIVAAAGNIGNVTLSNGNVSAGFFIGNGYLLTGVLPSVARIDIIGNVTGDSENVSNVIAVAGNVANVRLVGGNVAVSGQINALGNVVAPFFIGNGSQLDWSNFYITGNCEP
ncbi:Chlorovirus glycoprotein repeat domain-containing protein [Acanthocystis turfacea Chlorella virus WI0606]|nr:Chlorovirus glycoprotein repeat domain-containing protein [Acanthocystis turfacea Chlorella virus WI0606]